MIARMATMAGATLLAMAVGSAWGQAVEATFVGESADGLYTAALLPASDAIALNVMESWTLVVRDAQGAPVTDAGITVDGGMPAHGHGLPTAPAVTEDLGGGHYLVEGIRFTMAGDWVLFFDIQSAIGADRVTFRLSL